MVGGPKKQNKIFFLQVRKCRVAKVALKDNQAINRRGENDGKGWISIGNEGLNDGEVEIGEEIFSLATRR